MSKSAERKPGASSTPTDRSARHPQPGSPVYLKAHPRGCVIRVWLQPGAHRNAVLGEHADALRIAVAAAPQRGQANQALLGYLAELLHLAKADLTLLHGHTTRQKEILVVGLGCEQVQKLLRASIPPSK